MNKHSNLNLALKQYRRSIKRELPIYVRKRFLTTLDCDLNEYIAQHPNTTIDDIQKQFGEPKKFAKEYIASLDDHAQNRAMRVNHLAKIATIILALVGLVCSACTVWMTIENSNLAVKYYIVEITES